MGTTSDQMNRLIRRAAGRSEPETEPTPDPSPNGFGDGGKTSEAPWDEPGGARAMNDLIFSTVWRWRREGRR